MLHRWNKWRVLSYRGQRRQQQQLQRQQSWRLHWPEVRSASGDKKAQAEEGSPAADVGDEEHSSAQVESQLAEVEAQHASAVDGIPDTAT